MQLIQIYPFFNRRTGYTKFLGSLTLVGTILSGGSLRSDGADGQRKGAVFPGLKTCQSVS